MRVLVRIVVVSVLAAGVLGFLGRVFLDFDEQGEGGRSELMVGAGVWTAAKDDLPDLL